ncbi:MAG: protein kinase, partial [Polyangiales bacterium]
MADTPAERSSDPFEQLLERAARLSPLGPGDFPRLHPGRELCSGRLLVRKRLGAGGMGVVYEALDRERGSSVALKTLARLDANAIYRLKNEFRALAEVKHPNLVRLHELFVDGDIWLFTMELVVGEPFDTWVRPGGTLDPARLRSALAQLVAGVQAIHEGGKLHRDLKPSNVLVTAEERLVIMDFGLVSDPEPGGEGQTLADERSLGTPAYMAPEQAGGAGATSASDWYSFGVMLFEALTGELPIDGATYEILWRKQRDPAPRASSRSGDVPADLNELCAELLERDPARRPPASQIEELLREHGPKRVATSTPPERRRSHELVGRPNELAALRAALADAESGRLIVVRVLGATGLGKSALVRAFLDELTGRDHTVVLSGRCYEREAIPYKAFDRVIDELSRFLRQQPESEVGALLPRDAAALHRLFPVLGRVQAIADAPLRQAADDHALRRRAFDALAELLARIRDRAMLVVHIDDAHWTDADSVLLLEHLLGLPDAAPLLLLLGQRTPATIEPLLPRLRSVALENPRMELRDLELGPLSLHDATELAQRRLGAQHARETAAALATEASGNPFLVCELARHAAEGGTTAVTLEEALRARVAALEDGERRLLELVAVSGRPTPIEVLAAAHGMSTEAHIGIGALCEAQLLRLNGARSYECYHDSIRIALYNRLPGEVKRAHHERLALAYEQSGHADPEVLFEHAHAAGHHARAGTHAVEAANATASSLAFDRSAAFLAHAIELLPEPETRRLKLRERRGEALSLCGRWADAALAFDEAAEHAPDEAERMRLLRQSAAHFLGCGRSREGLPRLRRVLQASGITWPRTRLGAWLSAGSRLFWLWWKSARPHDAMTTPATAVGPSALIAPGSGWTPSPT